MGRVRNNDYLKECIADAVIALLKEKPMEKITVEEIVKKAGVGRATYFRSFHSKSEAITFKFIKMWERYAELNDVVIRDRFDLDNALVFFEYNYSIRHILVLIYHAGLQEALHESFYRIMTSFDPNEKRQTVYREKFYAHGLYGLLDEWIKRDFIDSPVEMAKILKIIITG